MQDLDAPVLSLTLDHTRARARARAAADAGLPAGFRATGVACGIKPTGDPNVGIVVCDGNQPTSAVRFAATGTPAAPVLVSRERCTLQALRAVLANSGCANAATGAGASTMPRGPKPPPRPRSGSRRRRSCSARPARSAGPAGRARAAGDRGRRSSAGPRWRPRLPARDRDDRRRREARQPRARAARGAGARQCPMQGRGHDLAEVRDDAVLHRDGRGAGARDRRPAAGSVRETLVRALLREQASSLPTTPSY